MPLVAHLGEHPQCAGPLLRCTLLPQARGLCIDTLLQSWYNQMQVRTLPSTAAGKEKGARRVILDWATDLPAHGRARRPVGSIGAGIDRTESGGRRGTVTKGEARILVVDDQPLLAQTCAEILAEAGHSVHTACDGRAALDRMAVEPFDLLLADMKMPGMDGVAVLRRARELYPGLAAVMITSYGSMENAIDALRAGAQDLLLKPFHPDDLLRSVHEALATAEREATLQALRHKEQQLRSIYDNVSDVLFFLAVEPVDGFRFVSVNRVFLETTGLAEEQVIGQDYRQVIPRAAHELVLGKYREAIRERRTVTWEEVSVYPAGKKYGEVSVTPVFDTDGRCTHLVGTVHDVTEQRAAQEEMRASEERYRALFENSLEAILLMSPDGSVQAANPAACRMLGRTEEEIVQAGREGVVDTTEPKLMDLLAERSRTGTAHGELTMLRRDGTLFPAEISTAIYQDSNGTERTSMMVRDITERKRAEEALRESETRWRSLAESSPDHVLTLGTDLNIQYANFASPGLTVEDLIGTPLYAYVEDERQDEIKVILEGVLETRQAARYETSYPIPEGGTMYYESHVTPRQVAGQVVGLTLVARDITERKRVEEALRESEHKFSVLFEKAVFAASLSRLADGVLVDVNEAFETAFGHTRREAVGKTTLELGINPDAEGRARILAALQERGSVRNQELTLHTKSGKARVFSVNMDLVDIGDEQYILNMAQDVTERKRAEEETKQRARELATLLEVSQALTATLDLDTVLQTSIDGAIDLLKVGSGAIYLLDGETLVLRAATPPLPTQFPEELRRAPLADHPNIRQAITTGWPVVVADTDTADLTVAERAVSESRGLRSVVYVPLLSTGQAVGVWILASVGERRAFSEAEIDLSRTLGAQAASALANARLFEQVRAGGERLHALARHLQDAQEEERARVARELHDEFGQALTVLKIDLSRLIARLPDGDETLKQHAQEMTALIDQTVDAVRNVATRLRPGLLDRLGLAAAIEWQAEEVAGRTGLRIDLDLKGGGRDLDPDLATAVFRIFQEALTNVVRHAAANRVCVILRAEDEILLQVQDNGRGIAPRQIGGSRSWGLAGMRERARAWGGRLEFEGAPGQGTTLTLRLPKQ